MAMDSKIKATEFNMPSMMDSGDASRFPNYTVKYAKVNLDEPDDIMLLQDIDTKALHGDDIIIISYEKFTFETNFFLVIKYLEKK